MTRHPKAAVVTGHDECPGAERASVARGETLAVEARACGCEGAFFPWGGRPDPPRRGEARIVTEEDVARRRRAAHDGKGRGERRRQDERNGCKRAAALLATPGIYDVMWLRGLPFFSAFWLRSSVVSVLISLITNIWSLTSSIILMFLRRPALQACLSQSGVTVFLQIKAVAQPS